MKSLAIAGVLAAACIPSVSVAAGASDFEFVPREGASFVDAGPAYGTAVFDANRDGWLDLFVSRHKQRPDLYLNRGGFRFERVFAEASGWPSLEDQHGAAALDFDRDGDVDVYVTQGADRGEGEGENQLWLAEGDLQFSLSGPRSLLGDATGRGRGALWMDADRDGAPEILVLNYKSPSRIFEWENGNWTDRTGWLLPHARSAPGREKFAVSVAAIGDLDGDGVAELFTAGTRTFVLGFEPEQGWIDVGTRGGFRLPRSPVNAAAMADIDGDGDLDLVLAPGGDRGIRTWINGSSPSRVRLGPGPSVTAPDRGEPAGLTLADLDNDGRVDLLAVFSGTQAIGPTELLAKGDGQGRFEPVTDWGGRIFEDSDGPTDIWAVDLDHDGDLDLVNTRGHGPDLQQSPALVVYENRTEAPGLVIELESGSGLPMGAGAIVELHGSSGVVTRQVHAIANRWNGTVPRVHFGTGELPGPFELVVQWADGSVQRYELPGGAGVFRAIQGESALERL